MKHEYNFSPMDKVFFKLQSIACGEWNLVDLDKESAFLAVRNFCRTFPKDEKLAFGVLERAYLLNQCSIMASRTDTFENLQILPPFDTQGKQNLLTLLFSWIEKGEDELKDIFEVLISEKVSKPLMKTRGTKHYFNNNVKQKSRQETIEILSGDGESAETAVRFSTDNREKRVRAERWFLHYNYGNDWEEILHSTVPSPDNKLCSLWRIMLADKTQKSIYFSINHSFV